MDCVCSKKSEKQDVHQEDVFLTERLLSIILSLLM